MRILIIRHAEPYYPIDSLTMRGRLEAAALAEKMAKEDITAIYVSPLGRAKLTCQYTLEKMGRQAQELEWLREFRPYIHKPHPGNHVAWDWRPSAWVNHDDFYSAERWGDHPIMQAGRVKEEYDRVCTEFDTLLAKHGYVREGRHYRAENPNQDTIALYCHFGLEGVLLSHLMNCSPMILWQGLCAAPSSVTTVYTEEREEGIAAFRVSQFGDVSHLYAAGLAPSFAARYCETYHTPGQRRD